MKKKTVNNICIGCPPFEANQGYPIMEPDKTFEWCKRPIFTYPIIEAISATLLKNNDYNVYFLDAIACNMYTIEWFEKLDSMNVHLIFFEVKTPVIYYFWEVVDSLKARYPDMIVVLSGLHVTALPHETMNNCGVDYIITGDDYDYLLFNLVEHLNGYAKLKEGIYYRKKGR